jgi:non-specific serine/threonine protein kinase/serine/threonine-protein kinase
MDASRWSRVEALFAEALERSEAERVAFVRARAGGDAGLACEVESLLAAHGTASGPLDVPSIGAVDGAPPAELATGARVGAWRIGALLGRGGSGEVYRAERADGDFAQQAALKLLRVDAVGQLERFHSERRLLARLEHPGIARLLDGGVTPAGRPYAVLEFVDGLPIVEHANRCRLGLEERLGLVRQVADVVGYAHRNLIVHRDLKPANILVGGDGRVKLLDFGIAKLLETEPAASGDETRTPLTPDYAAPEQLTGGGVTTATDLYGLGVVLFELLVGERPFRSGSLPVAGALRLLLESPAPRPSAVAAARAARGEATPVPPRALVGDLDAIVARCLRRDPAERYPSAGALSADLERHLRQEPVEARERRRRYLLGRFLRRHRWGVAAAAALVLTLAGGLVAFAWQARRAAVERDAARRAADREEALRYHLVTLFRESLAPADGGAPSAPLSAKAMLDRSAERVLERYADDPALAGQVVETLADLYGALQDVEGQVPLLESFLARAGSEADPRAVAVVRQKLAQLELARGKPDRAAELLEPAEAFWESDPERYREARLESMFMRGQLLRSQGDLAGSIAIYEKAIPQRVALSGRDHRETANLYNSLAISLTAAGRTDDALAAYREALAIHERLGRGDELDALILRANTGTLAYRAGRIGEAAEILERSWRGQQTQAGDSASVAAAMGLWGAALTTLDRPAEALPRLREAAAMAEKFTGDASPLTVQDRIFLADALGATGAFEEARRSLAGTLRRVEERFGNDHLLMLRARLALARIDVAQARASAEEELRALVPAFAAIGRQGESWAAHAAFALGELCLASGRAADAVPYFAQAVSLREALLWPGSVELALARSRLGEARLAAGEPGATELLSSALPALRDGFGPTATETARAERVQARISSAPR